MNKQTKRTICCHCPTSTSSPKGTNNLMIWRIDRPFTKCRAGAGDRTPLVGLYDLHVSEPGPDCVMLA